MSKEITKLTNSSPILKIVDRMNQLIEVANKDMYLLDSFRNTEEVVNLKYKGLEIDKQLISIKTTGIYDLLLIATSGLLKVYISKGKEESKEYELTKDNPNIKDILLLNGDKILLVDNKLPIEAEVNLILRKNLIQAFTESQKEFEAVSKELENQINYIDKVVNDSEENLEKLKEIKESFQESLEEFNKTKEQFVLAEKGKGLSTHDYNNTARTKVDNIPDDINYDELALIKDVENMHQFEDKGITYSSKFIVVGGIPSIEITEVTGENDG